MNVCCENCGKSFDDDVKFLDEISCKICGERGVYISETEMLMCYSLRQNT